MAKLESDFARETLDPELERRFPGCKIIKQDPNTSHQGIPDRLVLWQEHWALLETKRATKSARRPNQEYYVDEYNDMSFSAFVHPANMQEVLDEMEQAFGGTG
jgi:hypothetical protein